MGGGGRGGGVRGEERKGEEERLVWGTHIGNTAIPSLDSTVLHHTACTIISMWMLTSYIVC